MKLHLLMFCLILGACTSLPQVMKDASVTDVTYTQAIQNIDVHNNTIVRWGGVIISVENNEDHTLIQALFYPLSHLGRPQPSKLNGGHFIVRSKEFIDPVIYANKKEITVVGTLNGKIKRKVGERTIRVPFIQSTAIHLWPEEYNYDDDYILQGL